MDWVRCVCVCVIYLLKKRLCKFKPHLISFCGANRQGIWYQQSGVLLLYYVDAGNWNNDLRENRGCQEKSVSCPLYLYPSQNWFRNIPVSRILFFLVSGGAAAHLCFLEQHWGIKTGVGVSDIQPTVVGHFLLQGTDVCWERNKNLVI